MKKWIVFLVLVFVSRFVVADDHLYFEYLSTCYKTTRGSWMRPMCNTRDVCSEIPPL